MTRPLVMPVLDRPRPRGGPGVESPASLEALLGVPRAALLRALDRATTAGQLADGRGDEALVGLWAYLDITALGRQEEWEDSPEGYPQDPTGAWVRRHDEYDASAEAAAATASAIAEQVERYRSAHPGNR